MHSFNADLWPIGWTATTYLEKLQKVTSVPQPGISIDSLPAFRQFMCGKLNLFVVMREKHFGNFLKYI